MKPIEVTLPQDMKELLLYPIADPHIGDGSSDLKSVKELIGKIACEPSAYVVLGGDLMNNAVKTGISDCYAETMSPMEELALACEILGPVADKVLAAVPGNHEERTYRQDGIDLTRILARELGFEDRYREDFAYLLLSFGLKSRMAAEGRRQSYTVYVNHGNGGGRKVGGKANRLSDLGGICDADLFLVGHTHTPMVFKDSFIRATKNNAGAELVERTFVNTSGWLDYGGYGARRSFQPSSTSCPCVRLDGTKRKIEVIL